MLVAVGAGGIGLAIARRQGAGKTVLLASIDEDRLQSDAAALKADGYRVSTQPVEVASRESVRSLARLRSSLAVSSRSSTLPACRRSRPHPKRSSPSASWARPSSSRSSAASSLPVAPDSSCPAWPAT